MFLRLCRIRTRYCALIRRRSIRCLRKNRQVCVTPVLQKLIRWYSVKKKKIKKCQIFLKKKQKRFGFMTLLQCAKKPLHSTKQNHWDIQIIGASARVIAKCFSEHLRSTRNNTPWFPVPQHFNSTRRSISDVQVRGVALCSSTNIKRKQREMRLIFQLGAVQPKGLNITFSFIWTGTLYTSCARY